MLVGCFVLAATCPLFFVACWSVVVVRSDCCLLLVDCRRVLYRVACLLFSVC